MQYPGDVSEAHYEDAFGTDSVQAGSYVLHCSDLNRRFSEYKAGNRLDWGVLKG